MFRFKKRFLFFLLVTTITAVAIANNNAFQTTMNTTSFSLNAIATNQLVLVITPDAESIQGKMFTFSRQENQPWIGEPIVNTVVIGRTGLAWGKGLHPEQQGLQKQEGDGKAPAGVFWLTDAFGYLQNINTQLNYQPMSAQHYCMDVKGSAFYNQIVSTEHVGEQAVQGSSEPMRRDIHNNGDHVYKKGIVVAHNPNNVDGAGSCIFMHLWRADDKPTAGCTAMAESNFDKLLAWLDRKQRPVMVALTQDDYARLQEAWALPTITM